ncbi:uncharacterized protein LOC124888773 [Capsicum annuum]|uniref:uncharacterized protein LOC124888773 n=1 Tax=Capsicum annuum TaxID=4072 RepID=UPI001FB12B19|nr:uncharacterized protein LOC124888773 [Capsicum annuum]
MSAPWPFVAWGMDVIGPIDPKASNGHRFILVAIDYFTEWVEVVTFKSVTKNAILVMSNKLSASLQRKEQYIVNAMIFLDITKTRLQLLRDDGWVALMNEIRVFCDKLEILVPKMDDFYFFEKSKLTPSSVTYSHHLRVQLFYAIIDLQLQELFYAIIDLQLQELNNRFEVVSANLLIKIESI